MDGSNGRDEKMDGRGKKVHDTLQFLQFPDYADIIMETGDFFNSPTVPNGGPLRNSQKKISLVDKSHANELYR